MEGKSWGSDEYVLEQFKRYYVENSHKVVAPTEIVQREFGFLSFTGRIMFRHIGFEDVKQLNGYLRNFAPAHAYFSAAYYNDPRAPMAQKGWLGADLVFDIDADHFNLPCQKIHDTWNCTTCGNLGTGHRPDLCPRCNKATFEEEKWLCSNCLDAAKYETQKLLDILIQDFGFNPSTDLHINFSGNRGYHVHVRNQVVKELDQLARREIVDYILGIGIKAELQGFTSRQMQSNSSLDQDGWRGRSVKALYDFIASTTLNQLNEVGMSRRAARRLIDNKEAILSSLLKNHPSRIIRYIDSEWSNKLLEVAVKEHASAIDTVVTTDLRRLIRIPNTLHGKTAWISKIVDIDELVSFYPQTGAIAFREGTEKVYIKKTPEIVLEGVTYGPYEEEIQELPWLW